MSSKNIKQCTICEQWFGRNNGGFMKHIWTCQQQMSLHNSTDKKCPRSSISLLSITTDYQSPEIDCNSDLYGDRSFDQTNVEVNNNDSFTDGDSIISSSDNSFEQYFLLHSHTQDKEDIVREFSPQQSNARNRFQVMLHDLIMKHKASLQMFDDICNLVNEYTSSPEFSVNTKLQSWKSFLCSIEGSYRTWLLRPNRWSGPKVGIIIFFSGRPTFLKPSKLREKQTDGEQREALLPGGTN
jgi:hypothetical protein